MYQTVWEKYSHYKISKNSNHGFDWQQFKSNFRVLYKQTFIVEKRNVKCLCQNNATNSLSRYMRRQRTCLDMSLFSIALALPASRHSGQLSHLLLNSTASLLPVLGLVISCP